MQETVRAASAQENGLRPTVGIVGDCEGAVLSSRDGGSERDVDRAAGANRERGRRSRTGVDGAEVPPARNRVDRGGCGPGVDERNGPSRRHQYRRLAEVDRVSGESGAGSVGEGRKQPGATQWIVLGTLVSASDEDHLRACGVVGHRRHRPRRRPRRDIAPRPVRAIELPGLITRTQWAAETAVVDVVASEKHQPLALGVVGHAVKEARRRRRAGNELNPVAAVVPPGVVQPIAIGVAASEKQQST